MFETLGDHAEGKRLHSGDGLVPCPAVAENAGQVWNLGDPPAVFLAFEFDREGQAHNLYCNTAGALPNKQLHPTGAGISWAPAGEPQRWPVKKRNSDT